MEITMEILVTIIGRKEVELFAAREEIRRLQVEVQRLQSPAAPSPVHAVKESK